MLVAPPVLVIVRLAGIVLGLRPRLDEYRRQPRLFTPKILDLLG
jgi:hypothetical protein